MNTMAGAGRPVLVAYPLSFDWSFLYWYFSGEGSPFDYSRCFGIKTAFAVKANIPIASAGRSKLIPNLRANSHHTHSKTQSSRRRHSQICLSGKACMGTVIDQRRLYSDQRFQELKTSLIGAPGICGDKACVYAIGSFGRREASQPSDLDLFIVSLCHGKEKEYKSRLTKLEEILLKADLIRASRALGFPDFSKDGDFLQHRTSISLIQTTRDKSDDAINTFTARLLLLLASKPLVGDDVHLQVINEVIAKYWSEFPEHGDCFMPAFLSNDILQFWRTLCLNYEARTSEKTPRDRANRKIRNYKLKAFLLKVYGRSGDSSRTGYGAPLFG